MIRKVFTLLIIVNICVSSLCISNLYLPKIKIKEKIKTDIVATVNGEKITKEELDERLEIYYGGQVLEEMIKERIILQEAKKYGISVNDEEIEEEIKKLIKIIGEEKYKEMLLSGEIDEVLFKVKRKIAMYEQKLIEKIAELKLRNVSIDQKEFEESLVYVKCRIILSKDEKMIEEAYQHLIGGDDFATVASYYSQDILTKNIGGDLGWTAKGQVEKELEDVMFSIKIGEISKPIMTPKGWYIVKCEDRKDITSYSPQELEDKKKKFLQKKAKDDARKYLIDIFKNAKIEINVR